MLHYNSQNTTGYTDADLVELNHRVDLWCEKNQIDPYSLEDQNEYKYEMKSVLAKYDAERLEE